MTDLAAARDDAPFVGPLGGVQSPQGEFRKDRPPMWATYRTPEARNEGAEDNLAVSGLSAFSYPPPYAG